MKKLINLLETNVKASSLGLRNTKTDNDTANDLISSVLLQDIDAAAVSAGVNVTITTAISGHPEITTSGNPSRHPSGIAVDIAIINNVSYNSDSAKFKEFGDKLYNALKNMGYTTNGEVSLTSTPKVVVWQVAGHYDHLHVSNATGASSGGNTTPSITSTTAPNTSTVSPNSDPVISDLVGNALNKVTTQAAGALKQATGIKIMQESKVKKITENIERIKELLK